MIDGTRLHCMQKQFRNNEMSSTVITQIIIRKNGKSWNLNYSEQQKQSVHHNQANNSDDTHKNGI